MKGTPASAFTNLWLRVAIQSRVSTGDLVPLQMQSPANSSALNPAAQLEAGQKPKDKLACLRMVSRGSGLFWRREIRATGNEKVFETMTQKWFQEISRNGNGGFEATQEI